MDESLNGHAVFRPMVSCLRTKKYNGKKTRGVDYCWTAISKPPWLTALARWPQEDTWSGGAQFIDVAHWERLKSKDELPDGFRVLPRWIGLDSPTQSLPERTVSAAQFNGQTGIDQSDRLFTYENGKLFRDREVLVDLATMLPDPQPSPADAHRW